MSELLSTRNIDFKTFLVFDEYEFNERFVIIGAKDSEEALNLVIDEYYMDLIERSDDTRRIDIKNELFVEEHSPLVIMDNKELEKFMSIKNRWGDNMAVVVVSKNDIQNTPDRYKVCFKCNNINHFTNKKCWNCEHENFIDIDDKFSSDRYLIESAMPRNSGEVYVWKLYQQHI